MKFKKSLLAAAVLTTFATATLADTAFNRIISLGDSSSDGGTYSGAIALDPSMPNIRYKFTTNFADGSAKVSVERLATQLGLVLEPNLINNVSNINGGTLVQSNLVGGTNYAQGGAFITHDSIYTVVPYGITATSVEDQIDRLLAQNPTLGQKDLVVLWAGFNDVNFGIIQTALTSGFSSQGMQTASTQVNQAALDYVTQIKRLKASGANVVLVNSLYDLSQAPIYVNTFPVANSTAKELSVNVFNATLKQGLVGTNVIYVDTAKLITAMTNNPTRFGFVGSSGNNNLTYGSTCGSSFLACILGQTSDKQTANSFIFTDIGHLSDATHGIVAQANYGVLQAIGQQSNMLVAPTYSVRQINLSIDNYTSGYSLYRGSNVNRDFRGSSDSQFWAVGGVNESQTDSSQINPSVSVINNTGTVGIDQVITPGILLGGAFSYSHGNTDFGNNSNYNSRLNLGTLYTVIALPEQFYTRASVQYGDLSLSDIRRTVVLGTTMITSLGETNGTYKSARIGFGHINGYKGWALDKSLSYTMARTKIASYTESITPVSLAFGDNTVRSNFVTLAFEGRMAGPQSSWLPTIKVSIDRDLNNDPLTIGIGPDVAGIAHITLDKPAKTFYSGSIGVQKLVGPGVVSINLNGVTQTNSSTNSYGASVGYRVSM